MSAACAQIEVLSSPAHTVVQDLGRVGHGHLGVSRSGAADWFSAVVVNRLVGNPDGSAMIEMSLGGAAFLVRKGSVVVSIGGRVRRAVVRAHGIDRPAPAWRAVELGEGDVLKIEDLSAGEKGYISFRGGLDGPRVLGSRSTHAMTGLGMKPLAQGDRLGVGVDDGLIRDVGAVDRGSLIELVRALGGDVVRAVRGDGFPGLGDGELSFVVDGRGDRVGVRLRFADEQFSVDAPPLMRSPLRGDCGIGAVLSEGVGHGVLQWPGDGTVIALGPDASPTGGYPVVGTVISADLAVLAQRGVGSRVRVRWVTVADARTAMGDRLAMLGRVFGGGGGDRGGDRDGVGLGGLFPEDEG